MSDDEGAAPEPVEVEMSVLDALKDVSFSFCCVFGLDCGLWWFRIGGGSCEFCGGGGEAMKVSAMRATTDLGERGNLTVGVSPFLGARFLHLGSANRSQQHCFRRPRRSFLRCVALLLCTAD